MGILWQTCFCNKSTEKGFSSEMKLYCLVIISKLFMHVEKMKKKGSEQRNGGWYNRNLLKVVVAQEGCRSYPSFLLILSKFSAQQKHTL